MWHDMWNYLIKLISALHTDAHTEAEGKRGGFCQSYSHKIPLIYAMSKGREPSQLVRGNVTVGFKKHAV